MARCKDCKREFFYHCPRCKGEIEPMSTNSQSSGHSEDQKIQWDKCKICEKEIAGANYCTDCQEEIDTGGNVQYCVYCESERFESREWCCEICGNKFVDIQQLHKKNELLQQDIDSLRPQNRRLQDALNQEMTCCHCSSKDVGFFTCMECETKEDARYRQLHKDLKQAREGMEVARIQLQDLDDALENMHKCEDNKCYSCKKVAEIEQRKTKKVLAKLPPKTDDS